MTWYTKNWGVPGNSTTNRCVYWLHVQPEPTPPNDAFNGLFWTVATREQIEQGRKDTKDRYMCFVRDYIGTVEESGVVCFQDGVPMFPVCGIEHAELRDDWTPDEQRKKLKVIASGWAPPAVAVYTDSQMNCYLEIEITGSGPLNESSFRTRVNDGPWTEQGYTQHRVEIGPFVVTMPEGHYGPSHVWRAEHKGTL